MYFLPGAVWTKVWFSVFSVNFLRNLLCVQSSFNIEDILTYLTEFNTFITDRLFPWLVVLNTHELSAVAVLSSIPPPPCLYSDTSEVVIFFIDYLLRTFLFLKPLFSFFILFCFDSVLCILSLANDPQIWICLDHINQASRLSSELFPIYLVCAKSNVSENKNLRCFFKSHASSHLGLSTYF